MNIKKEKGSITLFILIACLFLVFVLSGIYITNIYKSQMQEKQIEQMQKNYSKQLDRKEEIYEGLK